MKRITAAAIAAMSLFLVGHGTVRAAGQPQCDTGQQQGTQANLDAKKQVDAQKYQSAEANSATKACQEVPAQVKNTSSDRKQ